MSNEDDIKLDKNARPFPTEEKAVAALRSQELNPDIWGVYSRDGGFAIVKHTAQIALTNEAKASVQNNTRNRGFEKEKYLWVKFPQRGSTQEPEFIELSWEGNRITVARDVEVPMAGRFLGVCDNAVQQVFEPAGRGTTAFVKAGVIHRRPYLVIREATKADFDKYMSEGNLITKRSFVSQDPTGAKPPQGA